MASRNPQTQAKRARELALKDKREQKRAKKEARAAAAAAEPTTDVVGDDDELQPAESEDSEEPNAFPV